MATERKTADKRGRGRPVRPKDADPPFKPEFWRRVEMLRKYLQLSQNDAAWLYGVSRLTYYKWVSMTAWPQGDNIDTITRVTTKLATLVKNKKWPTPDSMALSPEQRLERLVAMIGRRA